MNEDRIFYINLHITGEFINNSTMPLVLGVGIYRLYIRASRCMYIDLYG